MRNWQNCTFLHSVQSSPSLLRNQSKAPSRMDTTVLAQRRHQAQRTSVLAHGDVDNCCASVVLALRVSRASLFIQALDNPLLDDRVSSLSLLMKLMLHPRCERVTRRAATPEPTT